MSGVLFRGGLPYGPEIKKLDEAFPVARLCEGLVIEHTSLEKVLGVKRGSSRYYGVVDAWINRQRNTSGIFMTWQPSIGLKVLNPAEILDHAETRTRQKIKQAGRAIKTFGWVDRERLDAMGQKRLDHQLRVVAMLSDSLQTTRKQLAIELSPVKSLPKRQLNGAEVEGVGTSKGAT